MTPPHPPSPLPDRASILAWSRVALTVGITFFPVGLAAGMAAKAAGFTGIEVGLMAVLFNAPPVQFALVELWAAGAPVAQIVLTSLFVNLRFVPVSLMLAPYFRHLGGGAARAIAAHTVAVSTFAVTYLPMQRAGGAEGARICLSAATLVVPLWIAGCLAGFGLGARIPARYDEGVRFVFPVYILALLAADVREARPVAAAAGGFFLAPLATVLLPRWGLIACAVATATLLSASEPWTRRGSARSRSWRWPAIWSGPSPSSCAPGAWCAADWPIGCSMSPWPASPASGPASPSPWRRPAPFPPSAPAPPPRAWPSPSPPSRETPSAPPSPPWPPTSWAAPADPEPRRTSSFRSRFLAEKISHPLVNLVDVSELSGNRSV